MLWQKIFTMVPFKSIMSKSSTSNDCLINNYDYNNRQQEKQQNFGYHYGRITDDFVALGDISVDKDIDKLRDIIRSLNLTLGRCLDATLVRVCDMGPKFAWIYWMELVLVMV